MAERTLTYLPLDEILPMPGNPKRHLTSGIDDSLDYSGYVEPVVIDERTGRLVSGHGRCETLSARRARGAEPPEGVVVDGEGRWTLPVVRGWSSRDDRHARSTAVQLNRYVELGGWDERELVAILAEQQQEGELPVTGFSDSELKQMIERVQGPPPPPEFPAVDPQGMTSHYQCPGCGFEWSGHPKPGRRPQPEQAEGVDGQA